jgi:hypothetical protein
VLWQPDRIEGGVRTSRHEVDTAERPALDKLTALQASVHDATK